MSVGIVNGLVRKIVESIKKNGNVYEFNMYGIMSDAASLHAMTKMAGAAVMPLPGSVFLGMSTRGLALAYALAQSLDGVFVSVNKSVALSSVPVLRGTRTSEYSTESVVIPECCLPQDGVRRPAYIVDDVVAMGGTVRAVTDLLKEKYPHLEIQSTLCVVRFVDKCPPDLNVTSFFDFESNGTYRSVGKMYCSPMVVKRVHFDAGAFPGVCLVDGEIVKVGSKTYPIVLYPSSMGHVSRWVDPKGFLVSIDRFPNGVPNMKIPPFVVDKCVSLLIDFQDRANLVDMLGFARVLALHVERLTIVVKYFPDGTMERVDRYGTVASAETVSYLLGQMPLTKGGRRVVLQVFDLHTLQNQFYFGQNVQVDMRSSLENLVVHDDSVVVFPDEGAHKRYGPLFERCNRLEFTKKRVGDTREVHLRDCYGMFPDGWAVRDGKYVIVDDMARTFGTILETLRWLEREGAPAGSVDVAVPNVDTQGGALLRFFAAAPPCFRKLYASVYTRDGMAMFWSPMLRDRFVPLNDIHAHLCMNRRQPMTDVVASENATKVRVSRCAFSANVPSGVPEQPIGDEVMQGAMRRARSAAVAAGTDQCVAKAFESGIINGMESVGCAMIAKKDEDEVLYKAVHISDIKHPEQFLDGDQSVTTGQRLQKKYNLASGESWLGDKRKAQLVEALACAIREGSKPEDK